MSYTPRPTRLPAPPPPHALDNAPIQPRPVQDFVEERPTPAQEWISISRNIFAALASHPGTNLGLRSEQVKVEDFDSREEYAAALAAVDEAATDRRGYAQAMEPMKSMVLSGKVKSTDPRIWQIVFAVRGGEFRPKYDKLREIVCLKMGIDPAKPQVLSGADIEARRTVTAGQSAVLGIPGATVQAAYQGVAMPRASNIMLEQVPTHDTDGNLIGEGRRKFLLSMHRMKGGHHPNPEKAPPLFDADDLGPTPKMGEVR